MFDFPAEYLFLSVTPWEGSDISRQPVYNGLIGGNRLMMVRQLNTNQYQKYTGLGVNGYIGDSTISCVPYGKIVGNVFYWYEYCDTDNLKDYQKSTVIKYQYNISGERYYYVAF